MSTNTVTLRPPTTQESNIYSLKGAVANGIAAAGGLGFLTIASPILTPVSLTFAKWVVAPFAAASVMVFLDAYGQQEMEFSGAVSKVRGFWVQCGVVMKACGVVIKDVAQRVGVETTTINQSSHLINNFTQNTEPYKNWAMKKATNVFQGVLKLAEKDGDGNRKAIGSGIVAGALLSPLTGDYTCLITAASVSVLAGLWTGTGAGHHAKQQLAPIASPAEAPRINHAQPSVLAIELENPKAATNATQQHQNPKPQTESNTISVPNTSIVSTMTSTSTASSKGPTIFLPGQQIQNNLTSPPSLMASSGQSNVAATSNPQINSSNSASSASSITSSTSGSN